MDENLRDELIACIEAGRAAREADVDHGANPHLTALRGAQSTEVSVTLERVSAWWDGWEEADTALSPAERAWREGAVYG